MTRYERQYSTDWDTLDRDEVIDRAYALGVAAALGEYDRAELDALRGEVDSNYDQSIVELAFEEGKNEGKEAQPSRANEQAVWDELVVGEPAQLDPDWDESLPTGGVIGLPEAVEHIGALERPDRRSTDALEFPEFLEKD